LSAVWTERGKAAWEQRPREAEAALKNAVATARRVADLDQNMRILWNERLRRLIRFYIDQRRFDGAAACLAEAEQHFPTDPIWLRALAQAYRDLAEDVGKDSEPSERATEQRLGYLEHAARLDDRAEAAREPE
jgi:tetratricopeptide (TPR) repeat protein